MAEENITVEGARDNARTKLKGICAVYRICDGTDTRVCEGHSSDPPGGQRQQRHDLTQ